MYQILDIKRIFLLEEEKILFFFFQNQKMYRIVISIINIIIWTKSFAYLLIMFYSVTCLGIFDEVNLNNTIGIQQYTHKLQHPNIATYSEITTFSRNQTKLQVFFKLQLLRSCNVLLSTDVL